MCIKIMHMYRTLERRFLKALKVAIAPPSEVAEGMGKAYRTLQSYRDGTRDVTVDSARGLSAYLRRQAARMLKVAEALDAAIIHQEEHDA